MSNERTDVVKLSSQGRITIPEETRNQLELEQGDYVVIKVTKIEEFPH